MRIAQLRGRRPVGESASMGDDPRLRTPVLLAIMGLSLMALAIYFQQRAPDNLVIVGVVGGVGAVLMGASIASGINWTVHQYWRRDVERRRALAVTPTLELVNAVSRLSPDQIGLVGLQNYRAVMELAGADGGPVYMLRTMQGPIPIDFVHRTLQKATPLGLPSIRQYSDGSPEREWARMFAAWCVGEARLAIDAEGPYAARWLERGGRYKAATMLGLQLFNEDFEREEE